MPSLSKPTVCADCQGTGFLHGRTCPACHGYAAAVAVDDLGLFFGSRVDSFAILERKTERRARGIVDFALLIFGLAGFALFIWEATIKGFDAAFTVRFWTQGTIRIFLFWISAAVDCYLAYRLIRETERTQRVRSRPYSAGAEPVIRPIVWEELRKLPAKSRIDISKAFSTPAFQALEEAYEFANRQNHQFISPVHLFAALLASPHVGFLVARLGINAEKLKDTVWRALERETPRTGALTVSPEVFAAIFDAYLDAYRERRADVRPIEFFAATVRGSETVQAVLDTVGAPLGKVENVITWVRIVDDIREKYRAGRARARLRPKGPGGRAMTAGATPMLDRYSDDMTEIARVGGYPPFVGREKEMEAVFRVIEGGRGSIILVGPHGVGKETILEGLAERMVEEDVPASLRDKRLISLSVPKLVSGATPAAAADRLQEIFYDIARARNVILAVPNIQGLVGVAVGGGRALDLAEILASGIERGLTVVATAAPDDYAAPVERSAIGRNLERVDIAEPEGDQAIRIVESNVGGIEYQNRMAFSYDAVEKAVVLSDRYLQDRYLPEKAIEVLREVAHAVRTKRGEKAVVTGEDVPAVVSEKAKIPVTAVTEEESAKLMRLEEEMHKRIVGQNEAVTAGGAGTLRARAELRAENRPIANFLFLGPTGVGKTELAKTVADVYFGSGERMIRLDMSEDQDQASIYRMIGAPGATAGGILTEAVRNQPFTLLLLDEIQKAHPDILNVFLQVMDDGRLTDNAGRVVDFTNVILIATSNAGSPAIQEGIRQGKTGEEIKQQLLDAELKPYFRPEFLNRFDGVIVFRPLTSDEIVSVARLMLLGVAKQLEAKSITLQATEEAVRELAGAGFDPVFGARPLRRVIQEKVQDAIATILLQQKVGRRDILILEPGGKIRIEKREGF